MTVQSEPEPYTFQWFVNRFSRTRDQASKFCEPIAPERFVLRPAEGVWSMAECYSHLNSFGNVYLKNIRDGINKAPGDLNDLNLPFPPRLIWKGVIKLFAPPYKMKLKTISPFYPEEKTDLNKEEVLEQFTGLQQQFISELDRARELSVDLSSIKVPNPLLKFVKMTLAESFAVAEVHQRRHMWQAEQILNRLDNAS